MKFFRRDPQHEMTQNKWNWASPNDPIKWLRQAVKNIIEISSLQALPVIPTHDGPKSKTYCTMPYRGKKKKKNSSCLIPNCTYDGDLEEIRTLNRKNGCITWTTINNMQRHIYNTLYLTAATCSQPFRLVMAGSSEQCISSFSPCF